MTVDAVKPLRRDAARNLELILAAAAKVFGERGLAAGVEEIAQTAGVGIGTLYRRFPTKDDLVGALVHDVLTRVVRLAESAAGAPAGTGLETFLREAVALQAERRGCLPRLWSCPAGHDLVQQARQGIAVLLADAKAHGRVRDEITGTDVTVLLWSLRGVIESTPGASTAWQRHLELLVAGLRPSGPALVHPR